jgi:hypothetical protein
MFLIFIYEACENSTPVDTIVMGYLLVSTTSGVFVVTMSVDTLSNFSLLMGLLHNPCPFFVKMNESRMATLFDLEGVNVHNPSSLKWEATYVIRCLEC